MARQDLTPWSRSGLSAFGGGDPFLSFRREMDRLFDDFFAPAEARSFASPAQDAMIRPSIEVAETPQAYTVTAELPGLSEQDVELNLNDNALTLSGEKRAERNEDDGGRRYSERTFGRFQRTIPFPAEVDADRVEARFNHGVLTVTLPKNERAQDKARRIEIRRDGGTPAFGEASAASGSGQ